MYESMYGAELVTSLNASAQHVAGKGRDGGRVSAPPSLSSGTGKDAPAMMALVLAMAGMMFLTTPCVRLHVTPSMLYFWARASACEYSHSMSAGSSLSILRSVTGGRQRVSTRSVGESYREGDAPLNTRGHSRTDAHSMQCSGKRGVLAIVQMGKAVGGVCMWSCSDARNARSAACRVGEGGRSDAPCTRSSA